MIYFILKLFKFVPNRFRADFLRIIAKTSGGYMYSNLIRVIYKSIFDIEIGYGSYGSCFKINSFPRGTKIGNYCSFGNNIKAFNANHPVDLFTTHPILYNPRAKGGVKSDLLKRNKLVIGHDVWIGEGVIILPKVTYIGDGSVIGAGSILTRNVESYSIVAGNPAKLIKKRFTTEKISELSNLKWWNYSKDELIKKDIFINSIRKLRGDN